MTLEASVQITHPTGLHARPAVKLAQLAASFDAAVQLRVGNDGEWVRARSTAKIMKLKARTNATLHFRADGADASDAVAALVAFVQRNFDEDGTDQTEHAEATQSPHGRPDQHSSGQDGGLVFSAEVASEGLAGGVIYRPPTPDFVTRRRGTLTEEQQALQGAVSSAVRQLERLIDQNKESCAQVIRFQIELLNDEEFVAPAMQAIANGEDAPSAWQQLLDGEISDYEDTDDEYFRARAADLRDLNQRVISHLEGGPHTIAEPPDNAVFLVEELTPSRFLEVNWQRASGAVMRNGSNTSHVAMLARGQGVPLLIKLKGSLGEIADGAEAIVDAQQGRLLIDPSPATLEQYRARKAALTQQTQHEQEYLARRARTADGQPINVYINVDDPALLRGVDPSHCDGIGLTRTEFLFHDRDKLPDEDTQYEIYRSLVDWAQGRPVKIRTLDAGGDKPISGLTLTGERNPFLGLRGVRLSLAKPEVFQVQLRALARAAVHGPLGVMVPMVTMPEEFDRARRLMQSQVEALKQARLAAEMPSFGMMVEVPAAALGIVAFKADFFSIGSNDLVQYVMAASRDCAAVSNLQDPLHPAVLELIERVAAHGAANDIEVSVCGEMAAMPRCLPALLSAGVRSLSLPPAALAKTKAALAQHY